MTTPPQNPWSAQPSPEQPAYGQPDNPGQQYGQPAYGQQPPAYGQPAYGQQPPAYGQQPPAYGQQPPAYGQPAYGQQPYDQTPAGPAGSSLPPYGMPAYPGAGGTSVMPAYGGYQVGGPAGMPAKPVRPGSVNAAFGLWMAIFLLGVVSTVLMFTGGYYDAVARATEALSGSSAATEMFANFGRSLFIGVAIFGLAVSAFIYLFFGLKMRAGRNWARIVLTVLGAILAVSGVSGGTLSMSVNEMTVAVPQSSFIIGWVSAGLALLAIVIMFVTPSNTYFRESHAYRAAGGR